MEGKLLFSVLLTFLLQLASAKFNVEKSNLRVTSPESLKDVYGSAIGNFGVPKYGGTLNGGVVYPKSNQKACKSFDEFDLSFKPKPGGLPVFLLVDRGGKWSTRDFYFRQFVDCIFSLWLCSTRLAMIKMRVLLYGFSL